MPIIFQNASLVAKAWAKRCQPDGRTRTYNLYFHGGRLFSYGPHYLVAMFLDDRTVLLNADKYSVSTTEHQSMARWNTRDMRQVCVPDLTSLERYVLRDICARSKGKTRKLLRRWAIDEGWGDPRPLMPFMPEASALRTIELARRKKERDRHREQRQLVANYLTRHKAFRTGAYATSEYLLAILRKDLVKAHRYASQHMSERTKRRCWLALKEVRKEIDVRAVKGRILMAA